MELILCVCCGDNFAGAPPAPLPSPSHPRQPTHCSAPQRKDSPCPHRRGRAPPRSGPPPARVPPCGKSNAAQTANDRRHCPSLPLPAHPVQMVSSAHRPRFPGRGALWAPRCTALSKTRGLECRRQTNHRAARRAGALKLVSNLIPEEQRGGARGRGGPRGRRQAVPARMITRVKTATHVPCHGRRSRLCDLVSTGTAHMKTGRGVRGRATASAEGVGELATPTCLPAPGTTGSSQRNPRLHTPPDPAHNHIRGYFGTNVQV